MLDCVSDAVAFHPLRLGGLKASYRGRGGMTEWFAEFQRRHHEHRISVSEVRRVDDKQVLAAGSLDFAGVEVGSFCGLHRVADGRILVMHHYLSDPDMIEHLGLIP